MKIEKFNRLLNALALEDFQQILDGSALVMVKDSSLAIASEKESYMVYKMKDSGFESAEDLRSYLTEKSDSLLNDYYNFNPVSVEHFNKSLASLIKENGGNSFVDYPDEPSLLKIFIDGGELVAEDKNSVRFQYGLSLVLNNNISPEELETELENWVKLSLAYNEYIGLNSCRFVCS